MPFLKLISEPSAASYLLPVRDGDGAIFLRWTRFLVSAMLAFPGVVKFNFLGSFRRYHGGLSILGSPPQLLL